MISIVIPVYNKEKTIQRTLESIITQDFEDYELIIVDDGSTDNSVEIISCNHTDKIKIYSKDNGGVSSARNYGVQKARGEWIVFMDADDWFEQDALNIINETITQHSESKIVCFNFYVLSNMVKFIYSQHYRDGYIRNNFFAWCSSNLLSRAGAIIYKKECLIKYPFNEMFHRYEDAEQLFRIMRDERIYRCSIPIMTYNSNSTALSKACDNISDDLIGHLDLSKKKYWEQYALLQLYWQGKRLYPNEISKIYETKEFNRIRYKFGSIIIIILKKLHVI